MSNAVTHKETVIPPPGPLIDGADWLAEHVFHAPEIGAVLVGDPSQSDGVNWVGTGIAGQVLLSGGPGVLPSWQTIVLSGHNMLSVTHTDSVGAASVQVGDLMYGNGTPKWDRLPVGGNNTVLVVAAGLPAWTSTPTFGDTTVGALTATSVAAGSVTDSGLTAGRVVFAGTAGLLADDTNLQWNNTTKRLLVTDLDPGTFAHLGTGTGKVRLGGQLSASFTGVGTTLVTTEEVLHTDTIPANSFASGNATIIYFASGTTGANANNKTIRARWGGVAGTLLIDSGTVAMNNRAWEVSVRGVWTFGGILRISATMVIGTDAAGAAVTIHRVAVVTPGTADPTASNNIVLTGQNGTATNNDVFCSASALHFFP